MVAQLIDVGALFDTVPRIARRPTALVTGAKHAVEIAHEMKKVQFLPSREQFFELRSHQLVAGNCTSEARSEAQLRYLDVNNVCSAPVVYRPITASEDNDLIRVCPVCKRKL